MGLKTLIQKTVQNTIKNTFGGPDGISQEVVYKRSESPKTYDPVTRTVAVTVTEYSGIACMFTAFTVDDTDDSVRPSSDKKALIPSLEISFIPKEDDKITDSTGKNYTVKRLMSDPASALYILHVRME